jgi:hypothetical protein
MLNLNYNIIGAGGFDRYSKEEAKGFIPFQVQYVVVAGGGGSAGGATLKAGQAGAGGQILQGGYCVQPLTNYSVTIGQGGNGGAVSGSLAITTGSLGQTSSFATITASGGQGGVYQNAVTLSFFGGAGNAGVYPPSNGNGGSGSQWVYNLGGNPLCYPPFGSCGEYITSSYYAGGGAGFIVGPPLIEYLIVGGGGGGAGFASLTDVNVGGGNGGKVTSGSFVAYPSESYYAFVGDGGPGATNPGASIPTGSCGTGSYISGSVTTLPFYDFAEGALGGRNGYGLGNNGTGSSGVNGLKWADGKWYGGGGAPCQGSVTFGGIGGGGNGCYPYNLTSFDRYGNSIFPGQIPNTNTGGGAGGEGAGAPGPETNRTASGSAGVVAFRYEGTPIATGGEIIISGSYTYHYFTASANFNLTLSDLLIRPGAPGESGAVTGSNGANNSGGGAGGSFYNTSGSKGGSGFVALRYEGAPIAEGGQITVTDHYTYHVYTASGNFYAIGQETNPNINPCP